MTKQITRAEFRRKYGDVQVTFSRYYKYTFIYEAELPDGKRLTVSFGGDSDQIYRHEVVVMRAQKVSELQPFSGSVYAGAEAVEGFYDY